MVATEREASLSLVAASDLDKAKAALLEGESVSLPGFTEAETLQLLFLQELADTTAEHVAVSREMGRKVNLGL